MSAQRRIAAFLELAEQDIDAAEALAARKNRYAAYHCQQAAEKLIKAVLLHGGSEAGLEHHLDALVNKLPEGSSWKGLLQPLDIYTPYATTYRYPTAAGRVPMAPSPDQVLSDAAKLRVLITRARTELLGR